MDHGPGKGSGDRGGVTVVDDARAAAAIAIQVVGRLEN